MEAKRLFKETKQGNNYYELISQRKAYKKRMKLINNLKIFE